jgi:thiol-disulfide isomerase/thioredoxin
MRYTLLVLILSLLIFRDAGAQQEPKTIPYVEVESVKGKTINTKSFFKENKPVLLVYSWGCSWGKACQDALDSLNLYYKKWAADFNVRSVAINYKTERDYKQCNEQIIQTGRWTFDFYWDTDDNFAKALSTGDDIDRKCPRIFIVDATNHVISSWWGKDNFKDRIEQELQKLK